MTKENEQQFNLEELSGLDESSLVDVYKEDDSNLSRVAGVEIDISDQIDTEDNLRHVEQSSDNYQEKVNQLQQELKTCQTSYSNAVTANENYEKTIRDLAGDKANLGKQLNQVKTTLAKTQEELKQLKQERDTVKKARDKAEDKITELLKTPPPNSLAELEHFKVWNKQVEAITNVMLGVVEKHPQVNAELMQAVDEHAEKIRNVKDE